MNTKILLSASAIVMGVAGIAASFLPQEFLESIHISSVGIAPLIIQILGSCYLGFAMMNWMSRSNLIGGIYNKPIAMANLLHFSISAMAIAKLLVVYSSEIILWITAVVYICFAICFAIVFFSHPIRE